MRNLLLLDVSILVVVSAFSISALSHIAKSWMMRKEFEIAMRYVCAERHAVCIIFSSIAITSRPMKYGRHCWPKELTVASHLQK